MPSCRTGPLTHSSFAGGQTSKRPAVSPCSIRVLVILGHPRKESFCGAIANAYAMGASAAGAEVRLLFVADMQFDPNVVTA